jgi:hypothetical protein
MDVIPLRPESEINQLNRLLQGINKKRQANQYRWVKISYGLLTAATLAGFLFINSKIESMGAEGNSQQYASRIYIYAKIEVN